MSDNLAVGVDPEALFGIPIHMSVRQRAASGGRAARLLAGEPVVDPAAWEAKLGEGLLVDPLRDATVAEMAKAPA